MNDSIKERLLCYLAGGVSGAVKQQDKDSGRFLTSEGGWATYLQDVIYPMALLYTRPGTPWFHRKSLLETIVKGGDALRSFQDAKGRWEFIKPDGSKWGKSYMPWTIYHWLETYVLLSEYLDETRCRSWAKGLKLCYAGIAKELKEPVAHNISNWHGMSLVRGSQVFGKADWTEIGRRQCLFTASSQHKDGYWLEKEGPTNGYNTIYVHALGLYYAFTKDPKILPCLENACRFASTFTYPDGTPVETIDGRQRYQWNARREHFGWPGFSLFPQGRRLVSLEASSFIDHDCEELNTQLASFIHYGTTGREAALPWQKEDRLVYGRKALIRRNGPWFVAVSGYSTPADRRTALGRQRFVNTRSNCLSVWNRATGLLIGGGNSRHDPFFSTFDVGENGGRRLEPDAISFRSNSTGETIRFRYGKCACLLRLRWESKSVLEFTFELPPSTRKNATVVAGFTMKLKIGSSLAWRSGGAKGVQGQAKLSARTATEVSWGASRACSKRVIIGEGWSLEMPEESTLLWPVYPYNPYAVDNASPASEAVAAVSVRFTEVGRRTFRLRID